MNYFLNLENGQVSINTYRKPAAAVTTVEDLANCYESENNESLTADLSDWIKNEGGDLDDDNLERLIEGRLGLQLYDYPELRDIQRDANEQ